MEKLAPLYLAPMASLTNPPMRKIALFHGADRVYTEMVNANGIVYESEKTLHLLETLPGEAPVYAHLYGSDPAVFAEAARRVEAMERFTGIDINAGCPVRRITAHGAGSALIKEPKKIGAIVKAITGAVKLPVTVKTRLGPHPGDIRIFDILKEVEDAGAAELAVHARFTSQEHSGGVNLDLLRQVKEAAGIPIIGNGGIRTHADATTMLSESGVDALMIARGALGNPWIFTELHTPPPPPWMKRPLSEIRRALEAHLAFELAHREAIQPRLPPDSLPPEEAVVVAFRCHIFRYLQGLKGVSRLRAHLFEYRTLNDLISALNTCFERETRFREDAPWAQKTCP